MLSLLTKLTNSFRNTIRVSNSLNPDQDRHNVGPDLGPSCLQMLSADNQKLPLARKELIMRQKWQFMQDNNTRLILSIDNMGLVTKRSVFGYVTS